MNTVLKGQKPFKGLAILVVLSLLVVLLASCGDATNTAPAATTAAASATTTSATSASAATSAAATSAPAITSASAMSAVAATTAPATTAATTTSAAATSAAPASTTASANATTGTASTTAAPGTGTTAAGTAGSGTAPQGWQMLSSSEGAFKALMPANPQQKSQSVSTAARNVNLVYFQVEGKVSYYVNYADYPADAIKNSNADAVLEGALNGQIQSTNSTSNGDEKAISLGQVPGREVSFKTTQSGVKSTSLSRVYLTNNRLYQLIVVYADSDKPADTEVNAFFDSFQITS